MPKNKSGERGAEKLWFNWPLVVGLIANITVWGAIAFWIFGRKS